MRAHALLPVGLGLLAACSSGPSGPSAPPVPSDPTSEEQAFSYITNLVPVQIGVAAQTGEAYVDTGDPFVLLDPTTFPTVSGLPPNGGDVPSVVVGSATAQNVYALATTAGLTSPDPAFPLHANLGCTAICSFVAAFNYRDVSFVLGPAAPTPPANLEAESVMSFSFEGGSVLDGVTIPRSRIVVPVTIEGNKFTMMLDSGASYVVVNEAAFAMITQDGRPTVGGGSATTTSGTSTTTLTRVASIAVGGAEVESVVIAHDSSFDNNLAEISTDTGEQIDGSLGGTYLHDFYVTVDYPGTKLHLARYSDVSFAVDPGEQIGIAIAASNGTYSVTTTTTLAAGQGVTAGDVVTSIDGQIVTGLPLAQAQVLLFGAVGASKAVAFGAAAHNANQTVSLVVEQLLPQ